MIDSGMDLDADVLRVAHHGSRTACTSEFLREVTPECAVISVGKDNGYGHPHRSVLEKLAAAGSKGLRTDEQGTIVMSSDGVHIAVNR